MSFRTKGDRHELLGRPRHLVHHLHVFFPRLTLLFSSVAFGGVLWWLGFIFAPRLLVAILATTAYWHTNTVLVVLTWFWALGGETTEKFAISRRRSRD